MLALPPVRPVNAYATRVDGDESTTEEECAELENDLLQRLMVRRRSAVLLHVVERMAVLVDVDRDRRAPRGMGSIA